jgi:Putative zinc-finger
MNNGRCARARLELGVYLLGAMEAAKRAQVDSHLAACPWCREELAGLAGLPALLGKVPAVEAMRLAPDGGGGAPGPPLEVLAGWVARTRRLRQVSAAAVIALIAGIAAVLAPPALHPAALPPAAVVAPRWAGTTEAANPVTGAWAAIRYAPEPWGTALEARVTGIPAGTRCQFWVTGTRGRDFAAGGWIIPAGSQRGWYPASVPVAAASLRGFEITTGSRALVAIPAR